MICASVAFYALAKQHGAEQAKALVRAQLTNTDDTSLPSIRTIARLRELDDVQLWTDFGGSATGKMRSRAAHAAWKSGASVWVSCDDDVEAPGETLRDLLAAVEGDEPAVCLAPYFQRASNVVSVGLELGFLRTRILPSGGLSVPCLGGGFGLVAVNRAALALLVELCRVPEFTFIDDDGAEKRALFIEAIADGKWWGEDLSFFRRLPADVRLECLMTGQTAHEGHVLDLSTLAEQERLDLSSWRKPTRHVEVTARKISEETTHGEGKEDGQASDGQASDAGGPRPLLGESQAQDAHGEAS